STGTQRRFHDGTLPRVTSAMIRASRSLSGSSPISARMAVAPGALAGRGGRSIDCAASGAATSIATIADKCLIVNSRSVRRLVSLSEPEQVSLLGDVGTPATVPHRFRQLETCLEIQVSRGVESVDGPEQQLASATRPGEINRMHEQPAAEPAAAC